MTNVYVKATLPGTYLTLMKYERQFVARIFYVNQILSSQKWTAELAFRLENLCLCSPGSYKSDVMTWLLIPQAENIEEDIIWNPQAPADVSIASLKQLSKIKKKNNVIILIRPTYHCIYLLEPAPYAVWIFHAQLVGVCGLKVAALLQQFKRQQ